MMKLFSSCKVTYFAIPGRGESIRLALAIGGANFQDDRVQFKDWPTVKPTTPWGSLPVLTLSTGEVFGQQRSILRMVGKEAGLYPEDIQKAALVDSLMDAMEDIGTLASKQGQNLAKDEKEAVRATSIAKGGPVYAALEKIDTFIGAHGSDGFAVGNSLTIADVFLFTNLGSLVSGLYDGIPLDAIDYDFPNLTAVRKTVRSQPAVVEWYNKLDAKMPVSFGPF
jgi:prostaglandin-H2 D-isomerase / glutathione transferase